MMVSSPAHKILNTDGISLWLQTSLKSAETIIPSFFILFFVSVQQTVIGQAKSFFVSHGNNISTVSCGSILFAPKLDPYKEALGAGSVLLRKPIDLQQPFETSFVVDFVDTTATDGGTFIFQSDTVSEGDSDNGLGFRGINRCLAVTFDAFQNEADNDPSFAHIAIQANGDLNHKSSNNLAGPVSVETLYSTALNTLWFHHIVTIRWNPSLHFLNVLIDNVSYISLQQDIVQSIFNGNSNVYYGFTASNTQRDPYPTNSTDYTFGYFRFGFGEAIPRYSTQPESDTCYAGPVQFFDNSSYSTENVVNNFQLYKWYWDFGDGSGSDLKDPPPHEYPGPGIYNLKFSVTNQVGCTSDTLFKKVVLGSKPMVDFSTSPICENKVVTFSDNTVSPVGIPVRWWWELGNGMTSGLQQAQTSFNTIGVKQISLKVRTEYGCEATTEKMITVYESPKLQYNYMQDCDANVQFESAIINNLPVEKWTWKFGDGSISSLQNPLHHYSFNDTFNSQLSAVSYNGCADTLSKEIVINKLYPFAGNDTIVAAGQPLQLSATGGTLFEWSPATGLDNAFVANPIALLGSDQSYQLTVKNMQGCTATANLNVKVYKGPEIYMPNAFTPNNDGLNDVLKVTAPGMRNLEYLKIYNRSGNLVFETTNLRNNWDGTYRNQPQEPGTYIWIIKSTDYKGSQWLKKGTVILLR